LRERSDAGLIILDTPPTAHALDFLDAPTRILDFLDNDATRWLLDPALRASRLSLRLVQWGGGVAARTIGRLIGGGGGGGDTRPPSPAGGGSGGGRERARPARGGPSPPRTRTVPV